MDATHHSVTFPIFRGTLRTHIACGITIAPMVSILLLAWLRIATRSKRSTLPSPPDRGYELSSASAAPSESLRRGEGEHSGGRAARTRLPAAAGSSGNYVREGGKN